MVSTITIVIIATMIALGATQIAFGWIGWPVGLAEDDRREFLSKVCSYASAYAMRLYAFAYGKHLYAFAYENNIYAFAYIDNNTKKCHITHMDTIIRTTKQIGDAIRRIRRQRNLTQEALGQKIHARQATISKLEAGEPATQLRTLMNTLTALDLELVIQPRSKVSPDEIEDSF